MSQEEAVTTRVLYSCVPCGLRRVPVDVPARGEEDVLAWMEKLGHAMSMDHARRSPHCHPESLTEVMIPMTGTDRVGGPVLS